LRFLAWDGILCDMGNHTHIELPSEERTELEQLIRTGNAPARTHTRARILLLSDRSQGQKRTDQEGADAVLCRKSTVRNVRRRFRSGGLQAALSDTGWPGAPPTFTGDVEAKLVMFACSEPPEGAARWTVRWLADKMVDLHSVDSMSHVTVGEILKKRNHAVASNVLVHWQAVWDVCCHDGRRCRCISATLCPHAPGRMPG
jgi:putative transposase